MSTTAIKALHNGNPWAVERFTFLVKNYVIINSGSEIKICRWGLDSSSWMLISKSTRFPFVEFNSCND